MLRKPLLLVVLLCCYALKLSASTQPLPSKQMGKIITEALEFSAQQSMLMYETIKDKPGILPRSAKDGKLITCDPGWWTSGFYPGTLWYLYEYSRDASVLSAAENITERIRNQQHNKGNHDVGFMINCSFGHGYRLTGREDYRQVITTAAHSLSTRFDPVVGCTRSWKRKQWPFAVIIDNMMNLELLTVGASYSGDNTYYNMAVSHADKTLENHFRPDGSSYHVVSYDTLTGKALMRVTHQGASHESAWSRGQAWGLYGYTMMYRQTRKPAYLEQAIKIATFIMNHPNLPKDKIPYWDFDAPGIPKTDRDASAGAIMASAFVELSTLTEGKVAQDFLKIAEQQIKSLASPAYRAKKTGDNNHFILQHSTGFMASKYEIDAPLNYADYYFVEALIRYQRLLQGKPVTEPITAYSENTDRAVWLSALDRISRPVLEHMSQAELRKKMPAKNRKDVTHLEALGRLIAGIAPWLELGPDKSIEGTLRARYLDLSLKSITHAVNPDSPDYLNFNTGRQPLVDAAFLAHGLLRARTQLWANLDKVTQERVIKELQSSRAIKASDNNWLLFSAMVEAALKEFTGEWEFSRVKKAVDKHKEWYKGDGWYGDGRNFHFDYYNSYVIQPMLMEVLTVMKKHQAEGADLHDTQQVRYARFAEHQERLIAPDSTYPVIGRSMAYRFGAFHALSDVSYRKLLPSNLLPQQVRCGLTAVIAKQINIPGTFDPSGWLQVGFAGYQPGIGEGYISTGSLYLASFALIALGLPASDEFWSLPPQDWTSKKIWKGVNVKADKALKE